MANTLPVSIARQIAEDYIASRRMRPGDQLPSVRELSRHYGVSNASIAHALSILQAQSVIVKAQGKGCFVAQPEPAGAPDPAPPRMSSAPPRMSSAPPRMSSTPPRTAPSRLADPMRTIAYVVPDTFSHSPLLMHMYKGVERAARRAGFQCLVVTYPDYAGERQQVARLAESGCEGIVLYPALRMRGQLRDDYLKRELLDYPIVLVDLAFPEQQRTQVVFDNYQAGYQMTGRLLAKGHRRIAFTIPAWAPEELMYRSVQDRWQGYYDALHEAGLTPRDEDIWPLVAGAGNQDADLRSLIEHWQRQPARATALIALEDSTAFYLMALARELDIAVPEELAIVGFDNIIFSRIQVAPFLTTQPDFEGAGEIAVRLLAQLMRGEASGNLVYMLPVPLRERQSEILGADEPLLPPARSGMPVSLLSEAP